MNFDFNRLLKQLKWDVLQNHRFLYIGYMVIFGFMLMLTAFNYNAGDGLFWYALFVGGLAYTSTLFNEMNSPQPKQFYLTTPSSHLEKFISKLLISTIGYTLLTMVLFMVISFITTLLIELRTGSNLEHFNPFSFENIGTIKSYLIIQSIFLLGAVSFRKISFLKTIAILLGIGFVLGVILTTVGATSLLHEIAVINSLDGEDVDIEITDIGNYLRGMENPLGKYSNFIYWLYLLALAPAMWVVTYFKLTEKEV